MLAVPRQEVGNPRGARVIALEKSHAGNWANRSATRLGMVATKSHVRQDDRLVAVRTRRDRQMR